MDETCTLWLLGLRRKLELARDAGRSAG